MRTLTKYLISIVSISIALYLNTVIKEESIIDKMTPTKKTGDGSLCYLKFADNIKTYPRQPTNLPD